MKVVQEIKKTKNLSLQTYFLSSYLISNRISPYLSGFYIKRKTLPNTITIHMILSGIIGGILFSMPNIYLKILGAIFIHLWFILDCSDGEVARYTKRFSKYGTELDFLAHLVNHPLFGFSLFMSLMQLDRYNVYVLTVLVLLSNLGDYLNRNLVTLGVVVRLKEGEPNKHGAIGNSKKWTLKKVIGIIMDVFIIYPNLILLGVLIYFVDYFINTDILYWYIVINVILTFLLSIRQLLQYIKKFHLS